MYKIINVENESLKQKQYITTSPITSNFVFKIYICCFIISLYAEGGAVVLFSGQRTSDSQITGSSSGWAPLRSGYVQAT